jgi:hypothetical protein
MRIGRKESGLFKTSPGEDGGAISSKLMVGVSRVQKREWKGKGHGGKGGTGREVLSGVFVIQACVSFFLL